MKITDKKILVTGATGGIGQALVLQLAQQNCELVISGRNQTELKSLSSRIEQASRTIVSTMTADISKSEDCIELIRGACSQLGRLDILINMAGLQVFKPLTELTAVDIEKQITINLHAPVILAQQAAILMKSQGSGQIVNIGSTFGSIAFANFSVYSAAKFGLRGFSEALRRELANTGIKVTYVAPRATRTSMNSMSVYKMAKETGISMDSPEKVAGEIIKAIISEKKNHFIGFPEKLFARINAVLPNLVDKALYKQNLIARKYV